MDDLPEGFRSDRVRVSADVELRVVHNGPPPGRGDEDGRPRVLLLHGFPEHWAGWAGVAAELADDHHVVVPDQRGCGRSDAPRGPEHYRSGRLVEDVVVVAEQLFGPGPVVLAGHDFGAAVAYATAFSRPALVERLVVVNGVHPVCFQRALVTDPAQAAASAYIHQLRAPGAGRVAAAHGFAGALDWLERHAVHDDWLTPRVRDAYRAAWEGPQRLEAMFDWYRASPIVVPVVGGPVPRAPLLEAPRGRFRVTMPHLVVWGTRDNALLASSRRGLGAFCDDLETRELADADHWVLHTHPTDVAALVRAWLDA